MDKKTGLILIKRSRVECKLNKPDGCKDLKFTVFQNRRPFNS